MTDEKDLTACLEELFSEREKVSLELSALASKKAELDREIEILKRKMRPEEVSLRKVAQAEEKLSTITPPPREESQEISESFFAQNLIGKIGVIILVIGLIAFVKYLFDRNLFSTGVKVFLGYVLSIVSVFFSYKNKEKRKVLSSILFTGAVGFSYALTFVSQHYFEIFSSSQSLFIAGLIALFVSAVGYYYSVVLFGFSLPLIFFAPIGAAFYLTETNFWIWTGFVFLLSVFALAVSLLKKNSFPAVMAWIITNYFLIFAAFDAPDMMKNIIVFYLFFALFLTFSTLWGAKKMLALNLLNTLITIFWVCLNTDTALKSGLYLMIIPSCYVLAVFLCHSVKYNYLYFIVFTFNLAAFLILKDYVKHLILLIFAVEAYTFNYLSQKKQNRFYENFSFCILILSFLSAILLLGVTDRWNFRFVINSFFIVMLIASAMNFFLYYDYKNEIYAKTAFYFGVFLLILAINHNFFYNSNDDGILEISVSMIYFSSCLLFLKKIKFYDSFKIPLLALLIVLEFIFICLRSECVCARAVEIFSIAVFLLSFVVSLKIPLKKEYNVLTEFVLSLILLFFILNEFMVRFKGLEIKSLLVSLFAAVYAAVLFVVGFKLKKKHLRYASIAIFVITALKIVLCDAWEQSLALKSVIFLTEGGIFLLISYLYSKFFKDK